MPLIASIGQLPFPVVDILWSRHFILGVCLVLANRAHAQTKSLAPNTGPGESSRDLFFTTFNPTTSGAGRGVGGLVQRVLIVEVHAWFVALGWLAFSRSSG